MGSLPGVKSRLNAGFFMPSGYWQGIKAPLFTCDSGIKIPPSFKGFKKRQIHD